MYTLEHVQRSGEIFERVIVIVGAVVIFTALLSVAFLGRKIRGHMWLGMFFILVGLALVGISDIVFKSGDDSTSDKNAIISGQ